MRRSVRYPSYALVFVVLGCCLAGASVVAALPADGVYEGTTAQGRSISVTVSGGSVTAWRLGFQCGGSTGTITVGTSCPIFGNSFSCGSTFCAPFATNSSLSGSFSGDSVAGSFTVRTTPGLSGCCTLTGNWSATLPSPEACTASAVLSCGSSHDGSNDAAGSTDEVTGYDCNPWSYSGPEYAYAFQPTDNGQVIVSLTGLADDLDLLVLHDTGTACDPLSCVAQSSNFATDDEVISFGAVAGETYYFVVDGPSGAVSTYSIDVACPIFTDGFESGNVSAWSGGG